MQPRFLYQEEDERREWVVEPVEGAGLVLAGSWHLFPWEVNRLGIAQ